MGSLLISLHFTVLPPLGWAIYHSTCTYTHTGMHKQMPLSSAHHKPECAPHLEGEYQIICKHCSIVHTHTHRKTGSIGPTVCVKCWQLNKFICCVGLIWYEISLCTFLPTYLHAHAPFLQTNTNTHIYACIHVSSWEEHRCSFDVAAGDSTKDKQPDESGWSAWIIPPVVNTLHYETEHTLRGYKGTSKYTCHCHEAIIRQN